MTELDRYDSDDQTVLGRFKNRGDGSPTKLNGLDFTPSDLHDSCARIRAAARTGDIEYLSLYGKRDLPRATKPPTIEIPPGIVDHQPEVRRTVEDF